MHGKYAALPRCILAARNVLRVDVHKGMHYIIFISSFGSAGLYFNDYKLRVGDFLSYPDNSTVLYQYQGAYTLHLLNGTSQPGIAYYEWRKDPSDTLEPEFCLPAFVRHPLEPTGVSWMTLDQVIRMVRAPLFHFSHVADINTLQKAMLVHTLPDYCDRPLGGNAAQRYRRLNNWLRHPLCLEAPSLPPRPVP